MTKHGLVCVHAVVALPIALWFAVVVLPVALWFTVIGAGLADDGYRVLAVTCPRASRE